MIKPNDCGSLGMGTWTVRSERRKAGGGGKGKKRGGFRVVKPPIGGWPGGDSTKNGSKR